MKRIYPLLILAILFSCSPDQPTDDLTSIDVIPKPRLIQPEKGFFTVNKETRIYYPKASRELESIAKNLSAVLNIIPMGLFGPVFYSIKHL